MIVIDLSCDQEHRFEGWFASAAEFERQCQSGLVNCPHCGSVAIHRLPSAPYVQTGSTRHVAEPVAPAPAPAPSQASLTPANLSRLIAELRKVAEASEDVGERFADEARRIHHGDAEERAIRGTASTGEVLELWEEGITALPLPPAKEDLH